MKHYYVSLAANATAAKGDEFAKGDRFASNWDGEWWLATVKKVQANGDCDIAYDSDGHADTYPKKYMGSAAIVKLPAGTKKSKKSYTKAEVKAMTAGTPDAKPPKPAAEPKTKEDPLAWMQESSVTFDKIDPNSISEAQYKASTFLGFIFRTGRAGPSGTGAVIALGINPLQKKGHVVTACIVTPHKDSHLKYLGTNSLGYSPESRAADLEHTTASRTGDRLSYAGFVRAREAMRDYYKDARARMAVKMDQGAEVAQKHKLDPSSVGKLALVKWSNSSPTWKTIQGVKSFEQKFAINGGGSKLRWLSFSLILDVKDEP